MRISRGGTRMVRTEQFVADLEQSALTSRREFTSAGHGRWDLGRRPRSTVLPHDPSGPG